MSFNISFSSDEAFKAEFDNTVETPIAEFYPGPYEITPTDETQTLQVEGLVGTRNITINPIPQNYGLITWNGTTLTVS